MLRDHGNQWYTVTEDDGGERVVTTFRVRSASTHDVVNAQAYLSDLTRSLLELAESGQLLQAGQAAYQPVPVDVCYADDPPPAAANPDAAGSGNDGDDEEVGEDLWSPLHLALMLCHPATEQLLLFHERFGLPVIEALTAKTELPLEDAEALQFISSAASTVNGEHHDSHSLSQSVEDAKLVPTSRSGEESGGGGGGGGGSGSTSKRAGGAPRKTPAVAPAASNSSSSKGVHARENSIGSVSPQPASLASPQVAVEAGAAASIPILECATRQEMGGAVMLLGHYVAPTFRSREHARSRSVAVPAGAGHAEDVVGTPHARVLSVMTPTIAPPAPEDEAAASRHNSNLNELEQRFLADAEEVFCIANVLSALRPLLERVVSAKKGPETRSHSAVADADAPVRSITEFAVRHVRVHCESFAHLLHRPILLVEASVLYDVCGGHTDVLDDVLVAFQGALTPIFRGKKLESLRSGSPPPGSTSNSTSPVMQPLAASSSDRAIRVPTSRSSSALRTPRGQNSSHTSTVPAIAPTVPVNYGAYHSASTSSVGVRAATPPQLKAPVATAFGSPATGAGAAAAAAAALTPRQESVWFCCSPQEAQQLAFYASWLNYREQVCEQPVSARQPRTANYLSEYRVTVNAFKKMRESDYVPAATVWSGHVYYTSKLLSQECTVEEFLDFNGEGGFLHGLSSTAAPGTFIALLAAGTAAASSVMNPPALKLLSRKMDVLLAEVTGRPSPLRTYLASRPSTHAERFEELWLAQTQFSEPKKFKTRTEMLYFAVVELVMGAAERAWRGRTGSVSCSPSATPPAACVNAQRQADVVAALASYLGVWKNYFGSMRERFTHRRSMSRGGNNTSFSSDAGRLTPRGVALGATVPALSTGTPTDAVPSAAEVESPVEFLETVQKVQARMAMRLEQGREPLPAVNAVLFPAGQEAEALSSSLNGSANMTPGHADKSLPVSTLDNEFLSVQRCFSDEAESLPAETKLKFYGIYKQATVGDINIPKPWMLDAVGRAKWEAWNKLKGLSFVDAKRMYVNEYKEMKHK